MQNRLLSQYSSASLSVYAVWLPMLWGDSREKWNGMTMPDPRVRHFWDAGFQVGKWFARQVDGYDGISWDIYYLYGPDAVWETVPVPLVDSGSTIYRERDKLEMKVRTQLNK